MATGLTTLLLGVGALSSIEGVGDVFDVDTFFRATSTTGDCAGWLSDDG